MRALGSWMLCLGGLCAALCGPAAPALGAGAVRIGSRVHILPTYGGWVLRYDLATDSWLEPLVLPQWAGELAAAGDALYAAHLDSVARYDAEGLLVWNTPLPVEPYASLEIAAAGPLLLVSEGTRVRSLDAATGEVLDTADLPAAMYGLSVAPGLRRLFGRTKRDYPHDDEALVALDYSPDGSLGTQSVSPFAKGWFGAETWVYPDESLVADESGSLYQTADLAWVGHLDGPFHDLAFAEGQPLVLQDGAVSWFGSDGDVRAKAPAGYAGRALLVDGDVITLLSEPQPGYFGVDTLALSELEPPATGPPLDPSALTPFLADDFAFDEDGVLYILSYDLKSVFRYSTDEERFLETIPLASSPEGIEYSAAHHRLYLEYSGAGVGTVREIDVDADAPAASLSFQLPHRPCGILAAGDHLVACVWSDPHRTILSFGPDGTRADSLEIEYGHWPLAWSPGPRRLYHTYTYYVPGSGYRHGLAYRELSPSGEFGETLLSVQTLPLGSQLWASPDGSRVVSSTGQHFDGSSLTSLGEGPGARVDSAAWLGETLFTTADDLNFFGPAGAGGIWFTPGRAEHVEAAGYGLWLVLSDWDLPGGHRVVRITLEDLDGDGHLDVGEDEFPRDPNEWSDRDGDGSGDNGDAFPDDPAEWSDLDGDGVGDHGDAFVWDPTEWSDADHDGTGDNSDAFPDDPTEYFDGDGDGYGDLVHDAFPSDPSEWSDSDGDGMGDNSDSFPLDPNETRDFDGDGIGDRGDPFPVGEPVIGLSPLSGKQRLTFAGLGSLRAPLGGSLGLLPNGVFSLCEEGSCLFGSYVPIGTNGRRFALVPDPSWLAGIEPGLEGSAQPALSNAFHRPVGLDLRLEPETLRFEVQLDRRLRRGRVRMRIELEALLSGVPKRFQKLRAAWVWKSGATRNVEMGS